MTERNRVTLQLVVARTHQFAALLADAEQRNSLGYLWLTSEQIRVVHFLAAILIRLRLVHLEEFELFVLHFREIFGRSKLIFLLSFQHGAWLMVTFYQKLAKRD